MCYRPMSTGMERIKTLTSLRQPTIEIPDDFNELELDKQVSILYGLYSILADITTGKHILQDSIRKSFQL